MEQTGFPANPRKFLTTKFSITDFLIRNVTEMMEDVRVKFNLGLPWQKLRSTRRRLSLPANWT
jgi:hypothetical protein